MAGMAARIIAGIASGNGLRDWKMNQEMANKIGHMKREIKALNKKIESLTENKKILEDTCINQQHELNKLRSQVKRINEITRE